MAAPAPTPAAGTGLDQAPLDQVLSTLGVKPDQGLSADEAKNRLAKYGPNGLPEHDLPACAKCHAPGKRPDYPVLAGQKASYLAARLWRWRG